MAGSLILTETALQECQTHLEDTNSLGTAIEAYLTRHVVVLLCAEIESSVRGLVHAKADRESSEPIAALVRQIGRNIVRSAKHSEIKDILGYLGPQYATRYDELVRSSIGEAGIARLGNAVAIRDSVAHRSPPPVTFGELRTTHEAAEEVVAAVRTALDEA
ncbi:MAG: hypothetical protein O2895_06710 [Chloroflexi bacterium]|nr:hypothetical protein [Chloroflexota bacterium]